MNTKSSNKLLLVFELFLLFIALPPLFWLKFLPTFAMMPMLFMVFFYTFVILRINKIPLFKFKTDKDTLFFLALRVAITTALLYLYTLLYKPQNLFNFVKTNPSIWLLVLIFYPIFSAFTQEVVFRKFFFFRYPTLWQNNQKITIFLSALLFSYMHIVFDNALAVSFTFIGGLIFSFVYAKTKSLLLVAIEHGLYGDILFTLGLGYYFYHGRV